MDKHFYQMLTLALIELIAILFLLAVIWLQERAHKAEVKLIEQEAKCNWDMLSSKLYSAIAELEELKFKIKTNNHG